MLWGYAGVFPGEFGCWDGDAVINKLRFVAEHGFKSAHFSLREMKEPARRDEIAQCVADLDLQLSVGVHAPFFDPDRDEVKRRCDAFLADLELHRDLLRVPIVTTGVGRYHRFMAEPTLAEQLDMLVEVFTPLAQALHDMGLPFGLENHGDYYCSDLVELCERVPHMGIFLDTGNTYLIGEQSVSSCRLAAPYVIGTHFKDHYVHPDPRELKFVIQGAPLGHGDVNLRQIYMDMLELTPNMDKVVMQWEMIPPKDMDGFECLEKSWEFVRSLPEPGETA
jgi:sugar phosphate isomerase/epimerase